MSQGPSPTATDGLIAAGTAGSMEASGATAWTRAPDRQGPTGSSRTGDPAAVPIQDESASAGPRPFLTGLGRGLRRLCPTCGKGRLFDGYLRVRPTCDACGADNGRYPADDAPPYFTLLLVGHIVVAPMLALDVITTWPLWLSLSIFPALVLALTLTLLPFVKGGVIGAAWSLGVVRDPRE